MIRYLLDTNLVRLLLRGHPAVSAAVMGQPMSALAISALTEAELQFGLAERPDAKTNRRLVEEFLLRVDVLAWGKPEAACYGVLRSALEAAGIPLGSLDMMIAAHALAAKTTLVSNDKAFAYVRGLVTQDWSNPA
jgi:tRNA(fMet)-specific endonuclease VapC